MEYEANTSKVSKEVAGEKWHKAMTAVDVIVDTNNRSLVRATANKRGFMELPWVIGS